MATRLSNRLTEEERAAYRERGYHVPLRAFSIGDAARRYRSFLGYWALHSEKLAGRPPREWGQYLIDTHLFLRWVYEIVVHPAVLDAVESVVGPNVLVWGSQWFPKFAHDRSYVSWHQDAAYWGLSPLNVTTAWIAMVPSTRENGCMRVVPGTHRGLLPQRETYAEANMLSRGQEIAVEVDEGWNYALAGRRHELFRWVGGFSGSPDSASWFPRLERLDGQPVHVVHGNAETLNRWLRLLQYRRLPQVIA